MTTTEQYEMPDHFGAHADTADEYPATVAEEVALDDDLAPPRPRRRLPVVTAALMLVFVAALGFFLGVRMEKSRAKTQTVSAATQTAGQGTAARAAGATAAGTGTGTGAGRAADGTGGGGAGGPGGGAGGALVGQVKNVDGTTLYVTDFSGDTHKVVVPQSSPITKTSKAAIKDVQPGDNVVIQGPAAPDGSTTATRVNDTGTVGLGGGGFGGRGGGGFGGGGGGGGGGAGSAGRPAGAAATG